MSERSKYGKSIVDRLKWRYAVKRFDVSRKVPEDDWAVLEEALMLAPSSFGLQPYKFIVITDAGMKERLSPAAWRQPQITECSHLVVVAVRRTTTEDHVKEFFDLIVEVRGTPAGELAGNRKLIEGFRRKAVAEGWIETWSQRQSYIALGFLLETAALMAIDACPMEGFDPAQFDEILGLKDHTATVLCAIGYRDAGVDHLASLTKVRFSKEKLIQRIYDQK